MLYSKHVNDYCHNWNLCMYVSITEFATPSNYQKFNNYYNVVAANCACCWLVASFPSSQHYHMHSKYVLAFVGMYVCCVDLNWSKLRHTKDSAAQKSATTN